VAELREIKDKHALRAQPDRCTRIEDLDRTIVSGGSIVTRDQASVLVGVRRENVLDLQRALEFQIGVLHVGGRK
jgi:hypothetical protein